MVSDDVCPEDDKKGEQKTGKKKVLFLCTHNSARSQMAEGLLRDLYGERYEANSAGVEATAVHPRAVSVMEEIEIDISGQRSKAASDRRIRIRRRRHRMRQGKGGVPCLHHRPCLHRGRTKLG